MDSDTIVTGNGHAITFTRPLEAPLRGAAAALGAGLIVGGASIAALFQPGLAAFSDAVVWGGCGVAFLMGTGLAAVAARGAERRLTFRDRSPAVVEEVRTFGGLAFRRRLGAVGSARIGAVREDRGDGRTLWHLLLIDRERGRAMRVGDFRSEAAMRGSAEALALLRPDFAVA